MPDPRAAANAGLAPGLRSRRRCGRTTSEMIGQQTSRACNLVEYHVLMRIIGAIPGCPALAEIKRWDERGHTHTYARRESERGREGDREQHGRRSTGGGEAKAAREPQATLLRKVFPGFGLRILILQSVMREEGRLLIRDETNKSRQTGCPFGVDRSRHDIAGDHPSCHGTYARHLGAIATHHRRSCPHSQSRPTQREHGGPVSE